VKISSHYLKKMNLSLFISLWSNLIKSQKNYWSSKIYDSFVIFSILLINNTYKLVKKTF